MDRKTIKKILKCMNNNQKILLAILLKHSGSTPRKSGTYFIVIENGNTYGTIGGGLLEKKVIESSKKMIALNKTKIIDINLSNNELINSEMICGGNLSIILIPLLPNKYNIEIFDKSLKNLEQNKESALIFVHTKEKILYSTINNNSNNFIKLLINVKKLNLIKKNSNNLSKFFINSTTNKTIICLPLQNKPIIYIFGAGHVAQPTTKIASIVGFDIIIIDDRKKFANKKRFPNAKKIYVTNFENMFKNINIFNKSFIVIITRGHAFDEIVLEKSLETNASYIGMIGSKKKVSTIFKNLIRKGFREKILNKIHAPIGIKINAETPEEIALSIVSEIILHKSQTK